MSVIIAPGLRFADGHYIERVYRKEYMRGHAFREDGSMYRISRWKYRADVRKPDGSKCEEKWWHIDEVPDLIRGSWNRVSLIDFREAQSMDPKTLIRLQVSPRASLPTRKGGPP